jgi:hypothetical protein
MKERGQVYEQVQPGARKGFLKIGFEVIENETVNSATGMLRDEFAEKKLG